MGFLDALFSPNSSSGTSAAYGGASDTLYGASTGANKALTQGATRAQGALQQGAQGATDAINSAYGGARNDLIGYGGQAQGQLAQGRDSALATILGGNANYAPYAASGGASNSMLANALGLNGAGGHDTATAAFRAGPGYEFARDEAVDATSRKMAALGMAGSGNTLDAITKQASGLADQQYGSWLDRLSGLGAQGLAAAGGISNNNQAAGGIQYGAGATGAQLSQNIGSALGTLGMNQGNQLAGIQTGLGSNLGNLFQGTGQGISGNLMGTGSQVANLGMQAGMMEDATSNANNSVLGSLLGSGIKLGTVGALNPSGLKL